MTLLSKDGFDAAMTFKGTLDREVFEVYLRNFLAPTLKVGDIVIMDNSSVHTAKGVLQPIFDKGALVLFLPKYSA